MPPTTRTVLLLLATLLLACSGDDTDPTPRSTTTSTLTPEAEVEAAYLAYWDMFDRLVSEPDPESPDIAERAIGPAQQTLISTLTQLKAEDREFHAGEQVAHDVQGVTIQGDTATLRDCSIDETIAIQATTGSTIDRRLATDLLEVALVRQDGEWLVDSIDVLDSWDGVTPCAS